MSTRRLASHVDCAMRLHTRLCRQINRAGERRGNDDHKTQPSVRPGSRGRGRHRRWPAQAQGAYPDKLIKMIVPSPAGGQTDVLARLLAQKIQAAVGQNVIIDNRAGAGGALGARALAAAEPDGYTLFYGNTSTLAVIPAVSKNPGYDPVKNFAPIASVSESYMILVVHPVVPGQDGRGIRRLCQGQSRQAQLRARRRRQRHPPDRRNVPVAGEDRFPRRAAQGRRGIHHQPAGPAGRFPVREPGGAVAAHPRRQVARARASPAPRASRRSPMFRPWWKPACPASWRPC